MLRAVSGREWWYGALSRTRIIFLDLALNDGVKMCSTQLMNMNPSMFS